jgi:hypothetical protein
VPDHVIIAATEDVQHPGQTPDEIGAQLAALMQRAAEAERIALQCHIEAARLLQTVQAQHGFKSRRYVEFALAHGVGNRTDAYDLLALNEAGDDVLTEPEAAADPYHKYPSWREVWRRIKERHKEAEDKYWLTPPELVAVIRAEIGDDYHDICPNPLPEGCDALETDWPDPAYVNAPFIKRHEKRGRGLTTFARKSIEQGQEGKTIAMVVPVDEIVTMMLEAGAKVISLGRVRWLHAVTGEPLKRGVPCVLFILRPDRPADDNHPTAQRDADT